MHMYRRCTRFALAIMNFEEAVSVTLIESQCKFNLKKEQVMALQALCRTENVFVFLPTGFGKSLVYGFLADILDKV